MASQGPLLAGTGASVATGGNEWTTPGNVTAEDASVASSTLNWTAVSDDLRATNFGFTIPDGATIDGIVVEIKIADGSWALAPGYVRLLVGGSLAGTGKNPTTPGSSLAWQTYGNSTDLWGLTLPTAAQINASNFGVAYQAGNENENETVVIDVDAVRITVYYTSVGLPEINVKGNSVSIADGDTTPTTADHTDFGSARIGDDTVDRTFTIENTGVTNLTLNGDPKVAISGTHAADFSVTSQPSSPVSAAGSTTTTIRFTPGGPGVRTATVTITSDDADEATYNFDIQGTGVVGKKQTGAIMQ